MLTAYNHETGQRMPATSAPLFVHKTKNGWKPCDRAEAEAVSVPGVGLCQWAEGPELDPEVIQYEDADGNLVEETITYPVVDVCDMADDAIITGINKQADEHTDQIGDLETAACEIADTLDQTTADTETALCELADAVDETATGTEAAIIELGDTVDSVATESSAALMDLGDVIANLLERVEALEAKGE